MNQTKPNQPKSSSDCIVVAVEKLWTSPELLRVSRIERPVYGTQNGDIYSFGIIMQEIMLRDEPYSLNKVEDCKGLLSAFK